MRTQFKEVTVMASRPDCNESEVISWFTGQLPDGWFSEPISVVVDRDEILVTGKLPKPEAAPEPDVAAASRISAFREDSRETRIKIARAAQTRWLRIISWAADCDEVTQRFTSQSVPVMTRLHLEQRKLLDTLIEAGVARSRSDGLSWCVRQVQEHQAEWIDELSDAIKTVENIRAKGPS